MTSCVNPYKEIMHGQHKPFEIHFTINQILGVLALANAPNQAKTNLITQLAPRTADWLHRLVRTYQ